MRRGESFVALDAVGDAQRAYCGSVRRRFPSGLLRGDDALYEAFADRRDEAVELLTHGECSVSVPRMVWFAAVCVAADIRRVADGRALRPMRPIVWHRFVDLGGGR